MDYETSQFGHHASRRLSGYFDSFVNNRQETHDLKSWSTTLTSLQGQKKYLEDLLAKTAVTLNSLRDKQTKNERALGASPAPRAKKKKIEQNRWRIDKTIKTCENEERVILDCLEVCRHNIQTIESIMHPVDTSSTTADYDSNYSRVSVVESAPTEFDWSGWTNEGGISPFQKECSCPLVMDSVPPEARFDGSTLVNMVSQQRLSSGVLPPVPPNTASKATLSPEAETFEPSVKHYPLAERKAKEVDKLSISGLLASKRVQRIQRRRFSDAAIGHIFRRLSRKNRPQLAPKREHVSWGPSSTPRSIDQNMDSKNNRAQSV
ncbi:hypothetical protein EJ04DRAFT_581911 [Polyplosphaeria fusca]|uniref:Uncharacterized protein n=1 Tax=Polyplosphaeria fusca TaxID=682080 RepID=A0A9P4QMS3_9PLEO|nr:hypothetical protein EJ04DRAFT_581911 [Polyplosphaeria fusca]